MAFYCELAFIEIRLKTYQGIAILVKVHSPTLYLVYIAIGIMIIELLTVSIEPKVGLFSNIKDRRPVKIVATDHAGFLKM